MIRGIGLRGAIAINVITMIGIGPLITIPLVLNDLHGSLALWAWGVGALIALCDGLVWAELGSHYPGSGGTYAFLREAFGRDRLGRMLAFLFAWQIVLSAPLLLASGYIGFAHYAAYLWPPLADWRLQGIVASLVAIVTLAMLYRAIGRIAQIGIALGAVAIGTLAAVILASAARFSPAQALSLDPHQTVAAGLAVGLGPALVITLYDYLGYGQSCTVGDEVEAPQRNLPLSIVISVLLVGLLYVLLQIGVLGAIPWSSLVAATPAGSPPPSADYVASTVVERGWGALAALFVTIAILITAFASTYGNLLGFSRIPYAAARDGVFLKPFARLHERGRFPHVALVTIGLLAVPFCFLPLGLVVNALIAGLVIIQSLGQIAALLVLRFRRERTPYRMWLFPVPVLLATAGWIYIFFSAGAIAIGYGLLTLFVGVVIYLWRASVARYWPFAIKASALVVLCAAGFAFPRPAEATPTFTHAAIVERDGFPVFEVDGRPFFVYGAAFFYERLPQSEWARSMRELRSLGINTLDLYIIWNWHETSDGQFDFDGRTSPRRDLRTLLKLARVNGFKLIVRPGPVIRNEWRNGGYPAWLLSRPEYGMPLHDLLEGRYPPTATLQNAHSDDAAAEWMRNTTHLRYSSRWIRHALDEFRPYADLVLAVQLDDDQGAYLDNQTWPAPHLTAYLNYLKSVVHSVTGPALPVFINTYQMKVTASSPVWAMGNWYQSDAYSIGEHDRAQLEFSTGLLQTRPHQPLMYSEFQAGWLLGPDDIRPRPADPSNTLLAMTTLLGMGARGIVNFPAQDTLYPTGWEAPFANWFYAWDAALALAPAREGPRVALSHNPRFLPTLRVGEFVKRFGPDLAAARPVWDAGIAYLTSAHTHVANSEVAAIAKRIESLQRACRDASLACRLIDLRYVERRDLRRLPILFVPLSAPGITADFDASTNARLKAYAATEGIVVPVDRALSRSDIDHALDRAHHTRVVDFAPGATFAQSYGATHAGFLFLPNYGARPLVLKHVTIRAPRGGAFTLPLLRVPPRDALLLGFAPSFRRARTPPIDLEAIRLKGEPIPLRRDVTLLVRLQPRPISGRESLVVREDAFGEGEPALRLENALVRLIISPDAGARAFVFEDKANRTSPFTTVGALRDDVAVEPPLSKTDRIASYTHTFPAGMFNRQYLAQTLESGPRAVVRFEYDALDVLPSGAHFERIVTLEPGARSFDVDERVAFNGAAAKIRQRAVSVASLAVGDTTKMNTQILLTPNPAPFSAGKTVRVASGNALGFYDTATRELATIAWRPGDIEDAKILERKYSIVVRLTLAPDRIAHSSYGYWFEPSLVAAQTRLEDVAAAAEGHQPSPRTTAAKGKWRNGLRDRLKSG